ncbi:MAG: NADP-dependent oxidoreductase, partial [Pseudomonadota bacterium]
MTEAFEIQAAHRIEARPVAGDFQYTSVAMPQIGDGEILARVIYLSLDPYVGSILRGRHMGEAQPGAGDLVPGHGLAQIIESNVAGLAVGDYVVGETGWRSHAVLNSNTARKI